MTAINARKVRVKGSEIYISTRFRHFILQKDDIVSFDIQRIPSFFDEIGILLRSKKDFLVTERAAGFLDLAEFLCVEQLFGALWYRDAESGMLLSSVV